MRLDSVFKTGGARAGMGIYGLQMRLLGCLNTCRRSMNSDQEAGKRKVLEERDVRVMISAIEREPDSDRPAGEPS